MSEAKKKSEPPSSGHPLKAEGSHHGDKEMNPLKSGKVEISAQEYEDLQKKLAELEGLRERFLHAAADFENAKKRNAREKEDFIKFSQERILREMIPVLDNFERAIEHAEEANRKEHTPESAEKNFNSLISGVQRVEKQLFDTLKVHGLVRLKTLGEKFDPHFHEVVAHVSEEGPEDVIVDELAPGYMLHDRLLRAAKVRIRVSPKQTKTSEDPSGKQDEIT